MRVFTKVVIDSETFNVIHSDGYSYFGPFELCKGDPTAEAAEEEQNQFDQQLMQIFQAQYGTQSAILNYLTPQMESEVSNPQGYTAAQLAAQRTGATDTTSQEFQNAQQALNEQIQANSGGSKLTGMSGAVTEEEAALQSQEAQAQASAQEQITTNNANLQQQNYWNAINVLQGNAAQANPLGYASSATSGTNAVANTSSAVTASNQSQLLGALGGAVGGIGTALGNLNFSSPGTLADVPAPGTTGGINEFIGNPGPGVVG